jgi:iron complex outermembrane receptor protein
MSFQMKPIVLSVAATFGGAAALTGLPPPAAAQQTFEKIEITGSNIRRTDTETVAPVQIITREQIEHSGRATVAEVLRAIPSNTGGSFSESFSNSFAPGASGISLRGLGQKTTLVLLNGRRVAGYGFAQNISDTFVDLNAIPASAIDRIDILKDGASAIYGSDAIAGVVNIILRRDYKGVEAAADIGFFSGKKDYKANVVAGFGDLATQKFNVFGVLDFYKRDEVLMSDTPYGESRDLRNYQGGRNFQSLTAGGVWSGAPGSANPNLRRAISDCGQHGTVVDFNGAAQLGLLGAVPNQALNIPGNTWCVVDINKVLSALPGTERIGGLVRGTWELAPRTELYAEGALNRVKTDQTFTPPFFAGSVGLSQTPQGLQPFTYNITFAPGVAGNPLGENARFTGNLYSLGTRDLEITSDTLRGLVGSKYGFGTWDFDSAIGYSRNEIDQNNINRITLSGTSATFGVPTTPQPPVPVSNASTCNLDMPYSSAGCSAMLINFPRKSTSELTFVDTKANTELGQLPGGAAGLALGVEYRQEKIQDKPDPAASSGDILGQGITATDGKRHNVAGFIEFALPLTPAVEAQLALRDDYYSDFGNAVTPKVGLKIKPSNEVLLRANWGRGFRAPTLPEISPSVATFFTQVNDDFTGAAGVQISGVFAGNPALRPERSRTTTIGMVVAPTPAFSVSVDFYDIAWTDIVGSDSFQSIVDNDSQSRLNGGPGDPRVLRDPTTNAIITVNSNFRNLTRTDTRGVDFDVQYSLRTGYGRFTTRVLASYIDEFIEDGVENVNSNGGTNTIPRLKGVLQLGYEQGPLLGQFTTNYIHNYYQDLLAGSFNTNQNNPAFQNGTYGPRVRDYITFDLFARWLVTPKFELRASINNITNEKPPYDPGFSSTFLYDFSQYDIVGRIYRVGAKYIF